MQRAEFDSRGFRLSYLDSAPGAADRPAVLLLHGFPDQALMWRPQWEPLVAAGYRCIAPDTLGCGRSAMAPGVADYHPLKIAGDHVALLDHLGINRAHVVGHDWGAAIAWLLGGYHPACIISMAALSVGHPTVYARSGWQQKKLGWYVLFFQLGALADHLLAGEGRFSLRRVFSSHPDLEEVMRRLREPGRMTAALRLYRAALAPVLFGRHPKVSVPTLGVWSRDDQFLVESQMTDSQRYVDAPWRYERVPGHHWMSIRQANRINQLLLEHLGSPATAG